MKKFKTIVVVTQPRAAVWSAIRDRLPELVPYLDDVRAIERETSSVEPNGTAHLVNRWIADVAIPEALRKFFSAEKLAWLDRAEWSLDEYVCRWSVEPVFLKHQIACSGVTRYEAAIGGRGTRVTFEGQLRFDAERSSVPHVLRGSVCVAVETFLGTLIPKNFQKLGRAVQAHLQAETGGTSAAP